MFQIQTFKYNDFDEVIFDNVPFNAVSKYSFLVVYVNKTNKYFHKIPEFLQEYLYFDPKE
jgi:hypothetical protein